MGFDIAPYGEAIARTSELLNGILKRVLPEKMSEEAGAKLQQELTLELVKGDLASKLGQLAINTEEAKHDSIFVAGWRPAVGWTCAGAFAYSFVLQPFMTFVAVAAGIDLGKLPELDMTSLMAVLGGLLGLGGLRTYEKVKGVGNAGVGH
jgi:hypothetical protein